MQMNLPVMNAAGFQLNLVGMELYERIARGEPCPGCGAEWHNHELNHTEPTSVNPTGCLFARLADLLNAWDFSIFAEETRQEDGFRVVGLLMSVFTGYDITIAICGTHGYVKASGFSGMGFAGGAIHHWDFSCGCSYHDESDDVEAAR